MAIKNIINNQTYKWTTTEGAYLNEVPRLYAKSYTVKDNEILNALKSWVEAIKGSDGGISYYNNLHSVDKIPKDEWIFPYFEDNVRSFTNEWGDSFVYSTGGGSMAGSQWASSVSELMKTAATTKAAFDLIKDNLTNAYEGAKAAGVLYEPPKFYQYSANDNSVSVNFTLINTESEGDYKNNYALVKQLISDNRFSRESGMLTRPPVLWSVTVPGYRAIRWASCDVDVSMVGKRLMRDKVIVPEGYKVSLTYKSLYTEPSNFMDKVRGNAL